MTPDWTAEAAEIVALVRDMGPADNARVITLISLKMQLAYEAGRGAGLDEAQGLIATSIAKLGGLPS